MFYKVAILNEFIHITLEKSKQEEVHKHNHQWGAWISQNINSYVRLCWHILSEVVVQTLFHS